MDVVDDILRQPMRHRVAGEVRITLRTGITADVREQLDVVLAQQRAELVSIARADWDQLYTE